MECVRPHAGNAACVDVFTRDIGLLIDIYMYTTLINPALYTYLPPFFHLSFFSPFPFYSVSLSVCPSVSREVYGPLGGGGGH